MYAKAQKIEKIATRNFKKSEIINFPYDRTLLFGSWAHSKNQPTCDFFIDEKYSSFCWDSKGGSGVYKIINDSIYINIDKKISKGRIRKVTQDTLVMESEPLYQIHY